MKLPMYLSPEAYPPEYKTAGSSCFDLACKKGPAIEIPAGKIAKIGTGIHVSIPEGFEIQIRPRSGISSSNGLTVVNTPGTIDHDYRGELIVPIINLSDTTHVIEEGMRIAQAALCPVVRGEFEYVENISDLGESSRGQNGLGHTGMY